MSDLARRSAEERALGRLMFDELGRGIGGIGAIHRAIANRAFRAVGPGGRSARALHVAISSGVYGAIRAGGALVGRAADLALAGRRGDDRPPLSTTPGGSAVLAALNGLIGDALEREGS